MSYENKPGTGALFRQKDKRSENAPDYKGPFYETVDGQVIEREIAGWIKTSKAGKPYLSIKVGDKFVPAARAEQKPDPVPFNDEVPF